MEEIFSSNEEVDEKIKKESKDDLEISVHNEDNNKDDDDNDDDHDAESNLNESQQLFRREDMTIADLPDSEREKVSRLVVKLISLGREHEELIADLAYERYEDVYYEYTYTYIFMNNGDTYVLIEKRMIRQDT
jgi:hypothetical protein